MKKKVLISLGIIIIVGAVAGGILFTGGKEKNNSVNAMASIETASAVESEPEEKEESKEIEIEDTESESEEQSTKDINTADENVSQEVHSEIETPKESVDEVGDITPLDKTMYAKGNINTRTGPSTEYTKAGNLTLNESVHVTGQSQSTAWYQLTLPTGEIVYCSNQLLSDTKTETQQPTNNTSNNGTQTNNNQQQQTNNNTNNQQPSNNTTPIQDTPSAGGIEQGNLGGDNGFDSIIDIGKGSDWFDPSLGGTGDLH